MSERALRVEAEALNEQRPDEQEKETEREQGLRSAIKEIEEQRRQERIAQDRKEAEARAAEIARERYELEQRIEDKVMADKRDLNELEALHARHSRALREAGLPLDHGHRLQELISVRFRQWFGGFYSMSGTPAPFHGAQDLPLPERDPFATPGQRQDRTAWEGST